MNKEKETVGFGNNQLYRRSDQIQRCFPMLRHHDGEGGWHYEECHPSEATHIAFKTPNRTGALHIGEGALRWNRDTVNPVVLAPEGRLDTDLLNQEYEEFVDKWEEVDRKILDCMNTPLCSRD